MLICLMTRLVTAWVVLSLVTIPLKTVFSRNSGKQATIQLFSDPTKIRAQAVRIGRLFDSSMVSKVRSGVRTSMPTL